MKQAQKKGKMTNLKKGILKQLGRTETWWQSLLPLVKQRSSLALTSQDSEKALDTATGVCYHKRQETMLACFITEPIIYGFRKVASRVVGMFVWLDDKKQLQRDLKKDYIVYKELETSAGALSLHSGRLMAVASGSLHPAEHAVFEEPPAQSFTSDKVWGLL